MPSRLADLLEQVVEMEQARCASAPPSLIALVGTTASLAPSAAGGGKVGPDGGFAFITSPRAAPAGGGQEEDGREEDGGLFVFLDIPLAGPPQ